MRNGNDALEHVEKRLGIRPGQTTPDGLFSLDEDDDMIGCDHAATVVEGSNRHRDLTPDKLDRLLDDLRRKPESEGTRRLSPEPIDALTAFHATPGERIVTKNIGVPGIRNLPTYQARGGWQAFKKALGMQRSALVDEVKASRQPLFIAGEVSNTSRKRFDGGPSAARTPPAPSRVASSARQTIRNHIGPYEPVGKFRGGLRRGNLAVGKAARRSIPAAGCNHQANAAHRQKNRRSKTAPFGIFRQALSSFINHFGRRNEFRAARLYRSKLSCNCVSASSNIRMKFPQLATNPPKRSQCRAPQNRPSPPALRRNPKPVRPRAR